MQRIHQLVFVVSLVALSWLAMMAVHELGHVLGAVITGGSIQRVVLHPLTVSRTDVSPNPHPVAANIEQRQISASTPNGVKDRRKI